MLTQRQQEILLQGINPSRIAQRKGGGGKSLSYLEAWDVKAHMNRIFGFLNWSADVVSADLAYEEHTDGRWNVGYKVILRIRIMGSDMFADTTYTEAAVGSATLPQRGEAHDMAIKTAESDAFKRAAINLGDQFGLSLYNNGSTAPVVKQTLVEPGAPNDGS
jgi:DNA recombination protein Rad52